jgi:opacity protein-like surface antigen
MKRVIWILPAVLILCAAARAQEIPRVEITGGFSYLDANLSGSKFHLLGGGGSATENMNSWFGGRFEVNAFSGTSSGTSITAQTVTYGPVFAYRKFDRITPYAHVQFGVIHASTGYLGISTSASKFAMQAGGGADINLNHRTAIRLQADYLLSRFLNLRQNNLLFSTGVVLRFGQR